MFEVPPHIFKGSIAVLGMVITWVSQIEIIQRLSTELDYSKPLLSSLLGQSFMSFCFVFASAILLHHNKTHYKFGNDPPAISVRLHVLPVLRKCMWPSFVFTFLYQAMGYLWGLSIPLTKVATNTTLYQSYIFISFVLSVIFLSEKSSRRKVFSVVLTLMGIALIGFHSQLESSDASSQVSDQEGPQDTLVGIILTVASAILYSISQLYYALRVQPLFKTHQMMYVLMFSGMQGLVSFFILLPLVCTIWNFTGWEPFEFPTLMAFFMMAVNGICYLLYVPLMLLAIQWTSPTFVGVGCALTIPVSLLMDFGFRHIVPSAYELVGSFVTFAGVVGYAATITNEVEASPNTNLKKPSSRKSSSPL